jgi:HSP20 family protein
MMKMYMSPFRRRAAFRHIHNSDRVARHIGSVSSDVHVPLDVKEEKDAFVILATVPGLKPEDLEIEIINNTVNLLGEFPKNLNDEEKYLRNERPHGKFRRFLKFPVKLESAGADANLENGILTLRVPKVEAELPKTIEIKTANN